MHFNVRDDIIELTRNWTGERFPDGRPRVPDEDIQELMHLTQEQIWEPLYELGYRNQFESHLMRIHEDDRKLLGRAVTAADMPARPDLFELTEEIGRSEGRRGTHNLWVVDSLVEGDCVVVDMYDKVYEGTFVGGNLSTAIKNNTKTGGAVIWGGIRDIEQMQKIDTQVYYRGVDPTALRDFSMISFNGPVVMGQGEHAAMCLPGDIVYGCSGGVLFIPPQLVIEVVENGAKTQIKDVFGFEMITADRWTSAQVDMYTWTVEMLDELQAFIQTDPRGADYRDLDWSHEYDMAIHGEPSNNQSAL